MRSEFDQKLSQRGAESRSVQALADAGKDQSMLSIDSRVNAGTDELLYSTPAGQIAGRQVVSVGLSTTILQAAVKMREASISSLIVLDDGGQPAGIITDRDLRDKVVAGDIGREEPVSKIMSFPLVSLDAGEPCLEAVLAMIRHGIHHMVITRSGLPDGMITNHDLMMLQGSAPVSIAQDLENSRTTADLARASDQINRITSLLFASGTHVRIIMRLITEMNDRILIRVLKLNEERFGPPPLAYCWICFGSEGRREQTLRTDQDNAIIYADPANEEEARKAEEYFRNFTLSVQADLEACRFSPCPAGYMASNPLWRQPLKVWKRYLSGWIEVPAPDAVMKSLIFCDIRPVFGDFSLAAALRDHLRAVIRQREIFLGHMANQIIQNSPALGLFGSLITEKAGPHKDEINLKVKGLGPLVDIVRLFALEKGIDETSTLGRIAALVPVHTLVAGYADELSHAVEFLMGLRLGHQLECMDRGSAPDNHVNPEKLGTVDRKHLRDAFRLISTLQDSIVERYKALII